MSDVHENRVLNVISVTGAQQRTADTHAEPPSEMRMTDENGDSIFRFHLKPSEGTVSPALNELYRAQLYDLLKIVRLYSGNRPVLVDGFAFRNEPEHIQCLQPRTAETSASEGR
jgi:hypothetical protein